MPLAPKKRNRPWKQEKKQQSRSIDMSWFYNSRKWRRFSKEYKAHNTLCVACDAEGIVTPSKVTDHLVRYVDGGTGFDLDNLKAKDFQSLCDQHHNSKSGKESHGFKRGMG